MEELLDLAEKKGFRVEPVLPRGCYRLIELSTGMLQLCAPDKLSFTKE